MNRGPQAAAPETAAPVASGSRKRKTHSLAMLGAASMPSQSAPRLGGVMSTSTIEDNGGLTRHLRAFFAEKISDLFGCGVTARSSVEAINELLSVSVQRWYGKCFFALQMQRTTWAALSFPASFALDNLMPSKKYASISFAHLKRLLNNFTFERMRTSI